MGGRNYRANAKHAGPPTSLQDKSDVIDTAQPNGTLAKTESYPVDLKATATTHQQISRRAYELYLERGQLPGFEQEDWLEAEKQLLQSPETNPAKDRF